MKPLWILAPGVNYLTFLLLSVFFAGTTNISASSTPSPETSTLQSRGNTTAAATEKAKTLPGVTARPAHRSIATTAPAIASITSRATRDKGRIRTTMASKSTTGSLFYKMYGAPRVEATDTAIFTATLVSTTVSSLTTTSPQPSRTSDNISPMNSTVATSTGTNAATDTTSPGTETTTHGPVEQPLKFWGIILISLTVTAVVTAGCVGCCFFCTKK